MNIPTIKQSGGIIEFFIPGMFFFLNLLLTIFFVFPDFFEIFSTKITKEVVSLLSIIMIIILISLGYLFGIILRMLKVTFVDKVSSIVLKINRKIRFKDIDFWITDDFPYIKTIGNEIKENLSQEVYIFYDKIWAKRILEKENKRFFNFCKNILTKKDLPIITEVYAIETTLRFLSGMFYALLIFWFLFILILIFKEISILLLLISVIYFISILLIASNFKKTRIKEVETLFDACYQNRELFEETIKK